MSHSALNQAREGIMCIDQLGEIININAAGVELFNVKPEIKYSKKKPLKRFTPALLMN
jgi:sensor histidine kinase regulating citrate/malate metabolism